MGWALCLCFVWVAASDSFSPHHHPHNPSKLSASTAIPYNNAKTVDWSPIPLRPDDRLPLPYKTSLPTEQQQLLLTDPLPHDQWAATYCSVAGLREAFGTNVNGWWGDYDAATTRRLYHSLLPTALWELYDTGAANATTLAPLAYAARLAAKLYARERSLWIYRYAAQLLDGMRQFQRYRRFDPSGMTYEQVFEKYQEVLGGNATASDVAVCQKILERSCVCNARINKWCASQETRSTTPHANTAADSPPSAWIDLESVSRQLEQDLRELLRHNHNDMAKIRALRAVARLKRRIAAIQQQLAS